MRWGMLWFDSTPGRPLSAKISAAMQRFRAKYGRSPDLCYVHRDCLRESDDEELPLHVLGRGDVLPNHLWIGLSPEGDDQAA